jgi:hypothetical protein
MPYGTAMSSKDIYLLLQKKIGAVISMKKQFPNNSGSDRTPNFVSPVMIFVRAFLRFIIIHLR